VCGSGPDPLAVLADAVGDGEVDPPDVPEPEPVVPPEPEPEPPDPPPDDAPFTTTVPCMFGWIVQM
jgi:hypothetical protein